MTEEDGPSKGPPVVQKTATYRVAQTKEEAKELVRIMHRRTPAWKLPDCVKVLNAQPPDLKQIAKVSEIQFTDVEFVEAAAQTLAQLMEMFAEEAASSQARIDAAVDKCMQELAKEKASDDAEPQIKVTVQRRQRSHRLRR